jgi:hypothetical protein
MSDPHPHRTTPVPSPDEDEGFSIAPAAGDGPPAAGKPAAGKRDMPAVDWSLLPGNPAAFFGLAAGFDRQELRRRYSRLIRQFKPETHPAEFQQIRAAYESLDTQVRYGNASAGTAASAISAAAIWEAAAQAAAPAGSAAPAAPAAKRPASPQPARPSLASLLADEPPAKVYQQLAKSAEKSPQDFYALAVLSDVLLPDDPHTFLKWLLAGLKEHGNEPALCRLLQEHLRSDVPTAELPKALLAASKVITNDRFYFVTEAAWDRLLREADFALFRRTLAACEANLHDFRISAKTVFYVHILRAALWKADEDWLNEAFASVDANAGEMDAALENDWELTLVLREYRRQSERFAAGSRIRRRMDEAIRAFCTRPPLEAARIFVECQNELAQDAFGVMEAFPLGGGEELSQVVALWHMITAWISDDFGFAPPDLDKHRLRRQTLGALYDMRQEIDPLATRYVRFQRMVVLSWLATLIGGPIVLIVGVIPFSISWIFLVSWPAAAVALHLFVLKPKFLDHWLNQRLHNRVEALYQSTWRPRMFRHLHSMAVPAHVMLQELIDVARELGDDQWLGWPLEFLQADPGFPIYAMAQPFVR